jgi:hypothetical protein
MAGKLNRTLVTFILALLGIVGANGQTEATVQGYVRNAEGKAISSVSIVVQNSNFKAISSDSGYYQLKTMAYKQLTLQYSCIGYQTIKKQIRLEPGEKARLDVTLPVIVKKIDEVSVVSEADRATDPNKVNIKDFSQIPNASGNFEALIKTLPGVASNNELSSQYSVRGGNFDENLVYVNDIEIVRPFLIRSGQQEGLSFINPDMVSSVKFSAGGFEARYGDKMSSVLDVSYRKPVENQYSLSASLLGGSLSAEGTSKNSKFTYIGGFRYKTSEYLLRTMDTKGEYNPAFVDGQALISFQASKKLEFSFLGNFSQNKYLFIPQTRSTNFGTYAQIYNLTIYYDGQELDRYQSSLGAFTVNYKPQDNLSLKLISSGYSSYEQETFDIEGYYLINELDNSIGSSTYGDSLLNIGAGGMLNHARNYLWSNSWSVSHIGTFIKNNHTIRWALDYKSEWIKDRSKEWTLIDSAGYSEPYSPTSISLNDSYDARNNLRFIRISGYFQDTYQFSSDKTKYYLNSGLRFNYFDFTRQFLLSPRMRFTVKPDWKRDFMFYLASGIYYQPPSYKEMRDFYGVVNPNIKAQQSIHIVLGSDYNLLIWNRPFKLTSEVYYKFLNDLIPYKIDNVRIRYIAKNNAVGYATGLDLKLNGEFVPGIESWASLSLLKTEENQKDDYYLDSNGNKVYPGYYPRPTDQRVTFSLFFQDYLPGNPTLQMHMTLSYGSAFQVSPPRSKRFDQTIPMGPYRRVDLGLSKTLKDRNTTSSLPFINKLKEMKISLEIFNLLNIYNKASYLWVQTVNNQENVSNEFAVPNYLTSRRINVKLSVKF